MIRIAPSGIAVALEMKKLRHRSRLKAVAGETTCLRACLILLVRWEPLSWRAQDVDIPGHCLLSIRGDDPLANSLPGEMGTQKRHFARQRFQSLLFSISRATATPPGAVRIAQTGHSEHIHNARSVLSRKTKQPWLQIG